LKINICQLFLFAWNISTSWINKNQASFFIIGLILCISIDPLDAQTEIKDNLIAKSLREQPVDSALIWLNENYIENPEGFHKRALQALKQAYQREDTEIIADAHLVLMRWHAYHVLFTIDSIFYHGEKAIALFKLTNDQPNLAAASSELAFEYVDDNNLKRSEKLIFEAIEIYESLEDKKGLGESYYRLSYICFHQKATELSIKYALEALKISDQSKDYGTSSLAWLALLWAYHDAGELEKAINAGDKCIETIKTHELDDEFTLARAYGYRGDVWSDLKEYQKSLEDNKKSYAIIEAKIGAERPAAKTYRLGIGRAHYMQGNYRQALPHFEAAISGNIELGQGSQPRMQKIYNEVADCYFQLGEYKQAFLNKQAAHEVYDTLMQNKLANLEAEALVKYESGKKDQAIEEQSTIIEQKNRIQWLGIGLIGLLLLFTGTLFYYYRRNQEVNRALHVKNKENELLLKEIHHRVKNNLQTISSLLSLQSESISDKSALDAVQESKNRVASMALIHQKLYQGENLAAIEMRDYFETIGKAIKDSFGEKAENISLKVEMEDIELDVDTAVPIGLITNELITNSLKHAFPNKKKGQISITLTQGENNLLKLHIEDNGQNTAKESAPKKESGFGTLLVQLLTTQLGGKLQQSTEAGTSIMIWFPRQEKSAA
jgi:two-component sensor histidine kinase